MWDVHTHTVHGLSSVPVFTHQTPQSTDRTAGHLARARTAFGGTSTRVTQLWGPCGPLLLCSLYPTMLIGTVYHRNVQLPGGNVKLTVPYRIRVYTCTQGI